MTDARLKELFNKFAGAFIEVYGADKWNSLTGEEQHEAIMIILNDLNNKL